MGGKSKSSQSTSNKENIFNNIDYGGAAGGGGGGFAKNMNLAESTVGDISTETSTYINATDHGAVEGGVDIALAGIDSNADTMDSLIETTGNLAGFGFETALNFADRNADLAEGSLGFAESIVSESFDIVSDTSRDALQSVGAAYSNANQSILAVSQQSIDTVADSTARAYETAQDSIDEANENSLSSILAVVSGASKSVDATNAEALRYVSEAQKTESERTTDTLLKWGIGGMALVAVAFGLKGAR